MKLHRVKNDRNGNSRFVVNFLDLVTAADRKSAPEYGPARITWLFEKALQRARKIGGKRYTGKDISGGIVFQEYESVLVENLSALLKKEGGAA